MNVVSTNKMHAGYVPWILLKHFDVFFRGKEVGVSGGEGMKTASAKDSYMICNNGRRLEGEVRIVAHAPF